MFSFDTEVTNTSDKIDSSLFTNNKTLTLDNLNECLLHFHRRDLTHQQSQQNYGISTLGHPKKKRKVERAKLSPILQVLLQVKLGTPKGKRIRALCDSGASTSLLTRKFAQKLRVKKDNTTVWETGGGNITTTERCKIHFQLPQISPSMSIVTDVHITESLGSRYDMILGRDMLRELKINLNFEKDSIDLQHGQLQIPMTDCDAVSEDLQYTTGIKEPQSTIDAVKRVSEILDAKYAPISPTKILENSEHLTKEQKHALKSVLEKHEDLFDGTLGKWKDVVHDIELKDPNTKPVPCRPYSVPFKSKQTLKLELERLCKIGVLKRVNRSEWQSPSTIIPKKDQTVRFITDFRKLNALIKRKPYPLPNIRDTLLELEGFEWGTSLDLNMGYYHIELTPGAKKLCTIVFPFGKYEYQRLQMGLCNSPDVFQEHMSDLMRDLDYVRAYIDDVAVLTKGTWEEHLEQVDTVLSRLGKAGLKVNGLKSFFGRKEFEYLGYVLTPDGIKPVEKKVKAILDLAPPRNLKELRSFLGMVNYYRDVWMRRSHILAPLNRLVKKDVKWNWTDVEQRAFDNIKRVMSKETLLHYPDFNKEFEIHTDASLRQIGAVISQNGKPIAFYSRKLRDGQHNYTTTERELLAIVETLKEFRTILLGQKLKIYTDHKNLTFTQFNTERVMRWRLVLEEYNPELVYIKGGDNIVADALSRLELLPDEPSREIAGHNNKPSDKPQVLMKDFMMQYEDEVPQHVYPMRLRLIQNEQQKDLELQRNITKQGFTSKELRGGGKVFNIIHYHDKIVVPTTLRERMLKWYHETLMHPGINRTEQTIRQHFTWPKLHEDVERVCKRCRTCQLTKKTKIKYGQLPPKQAEAMPWDTLCIDLIGPYTVKERGNKKWTLHCLTMIDPATGWFEIVEIPNKRADEISNKLETTWLTRYPWPQRVICDRGKEFMAEVREMLEDDYGVKVNRITTRNPQANAIIERVHQTIGNMIRTFFVDDVELDENDPFCGLLSAVGFATRATIHTTLKATPSQLVFGRDAILNQEFQADWLAIKNRKQKLINSNNVRENAKRKAYTYNVGQQIMIKNDHNRKYGENAYAGPFSILNVYDNGTVRIQKGIIRDTINIRNISPFHN